MRAKRFTIKFPALDPLVNLKTRRELIEDYDYLNVLSEEEKTWLNKFTTEYVTASLNTKNIQSNFHNTPLLIKDCFNKNNARNRCLFTILKATNAPVMSIYAHKEKRKTLFSYEKESIKFFGITKDSQEDFLITIIEKKIELEQKQKL